MHGQDTIKVTVKFSLREGMFPFRPVLTRIKSSGGSDAVYQQHVV